MTLRRAESCGASWTGGLATCFQDAVDAQAHAVVVS